MGIKTAGKLLYYRLKKKLFAMRYHKRWRQGLSYSSWATLAKRHNLPPFEQCFATLHNNNLCGQIWSDELFKTSIPARWHDKQAVYQQADAVADGRISILGFDRLQLPEGPIPWHEDVTHAVKSPVGWQRDFYQHISILSQEENVCAHILRQAQDERLFSVRPDGEPAGHSLSFAKVRMEGAERDRTHDIKVPWELSRSQHLFVLGLGYHYAIQDRDHVRMERYAATFTRHCTDWLDNNPFLQGVNWTNPMEVAIRAINWTWAFYFFKAAPEITPALWERFITALYDHAIYLEHHWEISDKPNNHYLANVIGYLYLCNFFAPLIKRFKWLQRQTLSQLCIAWKDQMLHDGTSYEGSSAYHSLVTEMVLHGILIDRYTYRKLPDTLTTLFKRMHEVTGHLAYAPDALLHIGDNDSGTIVTGLAYTPTQAPQLQTYQHFGLTIMRQPDWLLTFRHPAYKPEQPTGHFHQDALSFTLSAHGMPLFIDPGTYLYTSHAAARNYLRSVGSHNTFFISSAQGLEMPSDLFQLPQQPQAWHATITHNDGQVTIQDHHAGYGPPGLCAWRRMVISTQENIIRCTDWWEIMDGYSGDDALGSTWVLSLAPGLDALQENDTTWLLKRESRPLATITTSVAYSIKPSFAAPAYGAQLPTTLLTATAGIDTMPMEFAIQLL